MTENAADAPSHNLRDDPHAGARLGREPGQSALQRGEEHGERGGHQVDEDAAHTAPSRSAAALAAPAIPASRTPSGAAPTAAPFANVPRQPAV